jgi:hypothetical protein
MEQPTTISCPACGEEFATTQQLVMHRHEKHTESQTLALLELEVQVRQRRQDESGEVF